MAAGKYKEWLTEEGLLKIGAWARDGLTKAQIAENMGISRDTLNTWEKKHPDISDTLKKGREVVDIKVENALIKRALGYSYMEVTEERIVDTGQKKRHNGESELTEKEWEIAIKYFNGKCCYCGKYMEKPTKDHIKPLIKGGALSRENIIPSCKKCNSSKKDNEMQYWYQKQSFYSKERAQKIHDYIDFILSIGDMLDEKNETMVVTKKVRKQVQPDVAAQIFYLKNRLPDKWKDKQGIDLSGEVNTELSKLDAIVKQMRGDG